MVEINSAVRTAAASAIELFALVAVVVASICLLLLTLFYVGVLFLLVFYVDALFFFSIVKKELMKRKDCNCRFFSLCHLEGVLDWLVEWMKREDLQRVALMKTQEPSCQRSGFRFVQLSENPKKQDLLSSHLLSRR